MADELNTAIDTTTAPVAARGTSLLEKLGLSSEQVLQSSNVESTILPKSTGALGILEAQETAAGIPSLRAAATEATRRRLSGEQLAQEEQLTIEGRRKRLGVLRGEQSQAAKQAALDIQTLLGGEQLAQGALTSGLQTAQQRAGLLIDEFQQKQNLLIQYPGLDIDPLKDDFATVSREIGKYTEKQKYIEVLSEYGKNTKGSRGALKKRYKSLLKKLGKSEREQAEKAESRADEKWELEKRNIESLISNRGKDGEGGFDPKSPSDIASNVREGLSSGDDWPTIYQVLTGQGADPDEVDKALQVATGFYQVGAESGGRSAF